MATMTINPTVNQTNKSWNLTWKAAGRYPIVADRIYSTLAQAQTYVDDMSTTASAIPGLVISVVNDPITKNNGVYYVESIANNKADAGFPIADKGTLVKVGGTETETATNYSAAIELSKTLVMGQLIKVENDEYVGDKKYSLGFYIVNSEGSISILQTSTGADNVATDLTNRVTALETDRVKVTDFNTYKIEVSGELAAKAGLDDFNTHKNNANIHVTADDKAKWNNAESNARAFTTEELAKLPSQYDAKGTAATKAAEAQAAAEATADAALKAAVGAYAAEGVEASGLRKEIAAAQAIAEAAAAEAAHAAAEAKSQTAELASIVGVEAGEGVEATGIFKTISGIDTRVATLEGIKYEEIAQAAASEAAAAAVAGVIDGAPEKFDTLKEIAAWIADADTADDAASLVTRVAALEAIDHNAYVDADTALEGRVEVYANGVAAQALADAKTHTNTEIGKLDTAAQGYASTAKDDAITAAKAHVAEVLESYYTKSEVDTKVSDDINTAKEAVIAQAQADIAKAIEDLGIGNYATIAYVDGEITSVKTYAENYTNELFASVKFADENDIDTEIFGKVTE